MKNKKYFYVQEKWGDKSQWMDVKKFTNLNKAIQSAEQHKKQYRKPQSGVWYKTRVATLDNGEFNRVHPPQKKAGD